MVAVNVTHVLTRARADVGSDAARAELVARFYPAVRAMVHRELDVDLRRARPWLASLFSTGDVVHDVFLGVLQSVGSFEGSERDFERYLAKAVLNRLIDAIRFHEAARRDGRRVGHDVDVHHMEIASGDTSPIAAAARREETRSVDDALATLTRRDQQLLRARLRHNTTFRQIALELGLPSEDAARKATRTAQARLLVALRARGLE